ncbi:MAG: YitT family protein [Chloroflexota bacterium]
MPDSSLGNEVAPGPVTRRPILPRVPGLLLGLVVFGFGIALMARAGIGLGPWEAFHQGIQFRTGIPMGTISILLGIPILALWWPLGERPGIGTLINVLLIGTATNVGNTFVPAQTVPLLQLLQMLAGVLVIGLGSGLYLAADLGPGPRDGLMVGVHHRFGWSIRRSRTAIEISVLVIGWALGGTIGLGTVVFAFGIGPVVQVMLGIFDREGRVARRREVRVLDGTPGTLGE